MKSRKPSSLFASALASLVVGIPLAIMPAKVNATAIDYYILEWSGDALQTEKDAASLRDFSFSFDLAFDTVGAATDVTLDHPTFSSPIPLMNSSGNGRDWIVEERYATEVDLFAARPDDSAYTVNISGGSFGTFSGDVVVSSGSLATGTPYLTGTTYDDLQGMDAASDFTFTWNAPNVPPTSFITLDITDPITDSSPVDNMPVPFPSTSYVLPGSTLAPGTFHSMDLTFGDIQPVGGPGTTLPANLFGVAIFDFSTEIGFATAGTPGGSETDPLLPLNDTPPYVFELEDGTQVVWIDPIVATGFEYAITSGPNFASVTMPSMVTVPQTTPYELLLFDGIDFIVETLLNPGDTYIFDAGGESLFRIASIDPSLGLDPNDPLAFPTGLSFLTDELVSFSMTPITITTNGVVPEPITLSLIVLGIVGIGYLRRRPAMAA